MFRQRVIPVLLLDGDRLVKTVKFSKSMYVGDPINTVRIFNEKEVDELILLDISASKTLSEPNYHLIEAIAGECFMPLTYGGGIVNLDQAARLFSLGVEKISLQTAAIEDSTIITQLADRFGSQSIVASVDVRRNWFGKPQIFSSAIGRKPPVGQWLNVIKEFADAGAGEILLHSVDKDGTLSGPDLELIQEAASAVTVPLIALGGVSSLAEIKALVKAGASAVAAGAFFVFHGPHRAVLITYPSSGELEALFDDSFVRANER